MGTNPSIVTNDGLKLLVFTAKLYGNNIYSKNKCWLVPLPQESGTNRNDTKMRKDLHHVTTS